jgi:hypothetical protein
VSALALLVVLSTLYTGYCYGWWGRSNLVLQYLLQCHSPPGSEQVRYREFTVLAPACRWPEVEAMSGDGRYLLITEHAAPATTYRLDLTTGERQLLPFDPTWGNDPAASNLWFLTTDLVLALVKGQRYVLMDVPSGRRVFVHWQYADTLATAPQDILHDAQHIIIAATAAVVLAPDPFARPDHNLVFYSASLDPGEFQARLRAVGVTTPLVHPAVPYAKVAVDDDVYARHERLWADWEGIHAAGSNRLLRPTGFTFNPDHTFLTYHVIGWTRNDQAVVYASVPRYVIERWAPIYASVNLLPVPQPVLLLPVP